ncbi:hypothetical protein HanRHA438_Chr03g0108291 [Helianthus annuus]|nr:hypothetical protein HanIR_Chr03g0106071 [Helianthus annuus]KAJ0934515.1 hypothetical protein HanRHA438_Chr03g0108291 [Helianthus annuus]
MWGWGVGGLTRLGLVVGVGSSFLIFIIRSILFIAMNNLWFHLNGDWMNGRCACKHM